MKWKQIALGDACEIVSGATPKTNNPAFWDGEIPWVAPKELSNLTSKYLDKTDRKITQAGLQSCSARMLPEQSILFSSRAPIGLLAINRLPVCTNQGFKSMVPDKEMLIPDFLYWWLKVNRKHLESKGRGATFKELSKKIVESIQIPLPPLEEQKRIAAILDAADALRTKRREALAELDTLVQSTFLEMFGDPVTNPKGWEVKQLGEVVEFKGGGTPSKEISQYWGGNIPWATVKDFKHSALSSTIDTITESGLSSSASNLIPKGHIIIPTRMALGKAAINIIDLAINQDLKALIPQVNIVTSFLLHVILSLSKQIERLGTGATVKGVTVKKLSYIQIPLPPLNLQKEFADKIDAIERQKERMRKHLEELDTLFAALQARAFNGEL